MHVPVVPEDELTLQEIRLYLKRLRYFFHLLFFGYLRGLNRHKAVMSVAAVVLAGMVAYLVCALPVRFEGRASFTYNNLQKKVYGEMADKLNDLIQAGYYDQVSSLLRVSDTEAASIKSVRAVNIYNSLLSEDMVENDGMKVFYVDVVAADKKIFSELGACLQAYFNNNDAVKESVNRRKAEIRQGIAFRQVERGMLDSLVRSYTASLSRPAALPYLMSGPPVNVVELFKKGEQIAEELADMHLYLDDHRVVRLQADYLIGAPRRTFSFVKGLLLLVGGFLLFSICIILVFNNTNAKRDAA